MNDKWTNIRISRWLHGILVERGRKKETFDETIKRLITDNDNKNKGE